ncbi:MAG: methyltransferase family protein [Candidatus Heimdallarchaeaceae archaeon]
MDSSFKELLKKFASSRIMKIIMVPLTLLTLTWLYAPVVATIVLLMAVWMVPLAFVPWYFFALFGVDSLIGKTLVLKHIGFTAGVKILLVFEILLAIFGFTLFSWGLINIASAKVKKEGLMKQGLYKFIRHPQHLGIILMALPFSLYIPGSEDMGIMVADILSWSLFSLILFLWSDHEERQLAKKFGEEFLQYRSKTGSFFPRIFNKTKERKNFFEIKLWKRYLFTFLGYAGFILILYLLVYILSLPEIKILR